MVSQQAKAWQGLMQSRFFWPLAALLLLLLVNTLIDPQFLAIRLQDGQLYGTPIDILNRSVPVALLALGMTIVIATAGIDLSVGAVMAIAGAVCANLLVATELPVTLVVLLGLGSGLLCGLVNASLIAFMGIQPIVATLLLMVTGRGIAQLLNGGEIVTFQAPSYQFLGSGDWLGLPMPIWIFVLVFALSQWLLRRTALGLFIEAVGCNASASRFNGINDRVVKLSAYLLSGLCAALAGIIVSADIQGADANNAGLWLELDAILAVVIGGASLAGGRFSIPLSLLGVLIIQTLSTSIMLSGLPAQYNLLIKALVVVLVLLLQAPAFRQQLQQLVRRKVV